MKGKQQSIRFSIDVHQIITSVAKKDHSSFTEALEKMIRENDRLHLYIRYLGTFQQATKEVPQCNRRLLIDGEFYCVQTSKKGLQKLKKLPLLDICRICRLEKLHIPASTKQKTVQPTKHRNFQKKWRDPLEDNMPSDNQGNVYRGK